MGSSGCVMYFFSGLVIEGIVTWRAWETRHSQPTCQHDPTWWFGYDGEVEQSKQHCGKSMCYHFRCWDLRHLSQFPLRSLVLTQRWRIKQADLECGTKKRPWNSYQQKDLPGCFNIFHLLVHWFSTDVLSSLLQFKDLWGLKGSM